MSAGSEARAPIAVVGLGNVLLGDDGFGPFVVEALRSGWDFPPGVELIDAGTPGLGLVTYLAGRDTLILIDTVAATGPPGEIRIYRDRDLRDLPPKPRVSPHDPAVWEALAMMKLAACAPEHVVLLGAIPSSLDMGTELSAPVKRAADMAVDMVLWLIAHPGDDATRRSDPLVGKAWWTRPVHVRAS